MACFPLGHQLEEAMDCLPVAALDCSFVEPVEAERSQILHPELGPAP